MSLSHTYDVSVNAEFPLGEEADRFEISDAFLLEDAGGEFRLSGNTI